MNFEDVKNSVNEWLWDNDERTYFRILSADEETKIVKAKGLCGLETEVFFNKDRFSRDAQKPRFYA